MLNFPHHQLSSQHTEVHRRGHLLPVMQTYPAALSKLSLVSKQTKKIISMWLQSVQLSSRNSENSTSNGSRSPFSLLMELLLAVNQVELGLFPLGQNTRESENSCNAVVRFFFCGEEVNNS
uniref:(northern house mosquito) hypothetical protein n=1 Tax=Culex pipiens TaxID=7175 RepID=A0A8D8FIQ8_CULPI